MPHLTCDVPTLNIKSDYKNIFMSHKRSFEEFFLVEISSECVCFNKIKQFPVPHLFKI